MDRLSFWLDNMLNVHTCYGHIPELFLHQFWDTNPNEINYCLIKNLN